jgi:hypothetical protein
MTDLATWVRNAISKRETCGLLLAVLSLCLLLPGLTARAFTIVPSFGNNKVDAILFHELPSVMMPRSVSLYGGVVSLLENGDYFLGTAILIFSIVLPIFKNLILVVIALARRDGHNGFIKRIASWCMWFLWTFGSWSMLDVFVVAVVLVGFKEFPGGTRFYREIGLVFFSVSVLLTMVSSALLKPKGS